MGKEYYQIGPFCVMATTKRTFASNIAPSYPIVRRLPGGDRYDPGHQIEHAVTSRQSCLAPVAYARLFSTVGRRYAKNDVLLRSGYPKRQISSFTVYSTFKRPDGKRSNYSYFGGKALKEDDGLMYLL